MADETQDPIETPSPDEESRATRIKRRLASSSGSEHDDGRPKSVYVILFGGVAALVILLFVVYMSSDRTIPDQPICSTISVDNAQSAVLEGRIRGVTIAYDDEAEPPSAENWGPVLVRLSYTDGQCANLPQGITQQDRLYQLIGTIQVYNDITENQKVEIKYDRSTALNETLFYTPTPIPTHTPEPSPTPAENETPEPRDPATPPPMDTEFVGPVRNVGTPEAAP